MDLPYRIRLSWRNAALAAVLTAGLWGLPWLLWVAYLPGSRAGVHRPATRHVTIRFIRASPSLDGTAWSPVMFPHPTKFGFSGTVGLKGMGQDLASVLKRREDDPPFLGRTPEPVPVQAGAVTLTSEPLAYVPVTVEPPAYMLVHSNRFEGYHGEWYEGLKERAFEAPALGRLPVPEGSAGWLNLSAWVELEASGRVAHAFLEQSSGQPGVDAAVMRALRMGQGRAGSAATAGRARVFYAGPDAAGATRVRKPAETRQDQ